VIKVMHKYYFGLFNIFKEYEISEKIKESEY